MGLPGSGKTTLAEELVRQLEETGAPVLWLNADKIRTIFNDWDFSEEGRLRQAMRMRSLCNGSEDEYKVVDFVAPLPQMREIFDAHFTIWLDTIPRDASRFADTNAVFVKPENVDVYVHTKNAEQWSKFIMMTLAEKGLLKNQESNSNK